MKTRAITALVAAAGAATAASAQVTATYSIAFGAPNGPNTITLPQGASTSVYVNVTYAGQAPNPILGLADGGFSLTGLASGGATGGWGVDSNTASPTYSLPNPWGAQAVGGLGVSVGTPAGNANLNGVIWGYGFLFNSNHTSPGNPATVWQGTFTATSATGVFNVSFTGLEPSNVFTNTAPFPTPVGATSLPGVGGVITIPAPASLALLGLGGLVALRRRR